LVDYRAPKADKLTAHPLPSGMTDVRKMLGACVTGREAALVALCGLLGLRVAEALGVRVVDFDFAERTLTVRGGKGDKDRTIPVHDEAWSPIFRGIDEQPINSEPLIRTGNRNARRLLTEIGARCGVKVASHDLRSTVLTEMYRVSKDLRAVQEFAGHASSSTTEAYTGIRMKDMRDAIGAI
jgi:integrase/recombinase XerD